MIGNIINRINKLAGVVFFNNLSTFSYNFFNILYEKNILQKETVNESKILELYDQNGFVQFKGVDEEKIKKINYELSNQNVFKQADNRFVYEVNENVKKLIKSAINEDFFEILEKLRIYYNSNIFLGHALITRNYNYDPTKGESYSNYYHCDGYLHTYFKIIINLSDVDSSMGPTNILDKKSTKKNIGLFKYSSRNHENEKKINSKIFQNISKIGDCLLVNTTQCLHKAGVPEKNKFRDTLFLIFCAYPNKEENIFSFEDEYGNSIWGKNSKLVQILAKPYGLRKLFKLYKNFFKNKLLN